MEQAGAPVPVLKVRSAVTPSQTSSPGGND